MPVTECTHCGARKDVSWDWTHSNDGYTFRKPFECPNCADYSELDYHELRRIGSYEGHSLGSNPSTGVIINVLQKDWQ